MPRSSPVKETGHHSDPSTSSLTPLRSDFLSGSSGIRSRSLSPKKRLVKQPLHIRMNLTENQMDKLTDAFSYKVASAPSTTRKRGEMVTPSATPRKHRPSKSGPEYSYGWATSDDESAGLNSPTFSELMPGREQNGQKDLFSSSLAGRRQRATPAPIQTGTDRRYYTTPQRPEMDAVPDSISPLSHGNCDHSRYDVDDEDSASAYSQDIRYSSQPEPLDLRRDHHNRSQSKVNNAVIDSYKDWAQMNSPSTNREPPPRQESLMNRPRRSKSNAEGLRQANLAGQQTLQVPQQPTMPPQDTPLFSPLQFYFRGPDYPTVKKGEKTMIGDNGWLERTEKLQEATKKAAPKKIGIIDSIKKIAKDMADLSHNARRTQQPIKERPVSRVTISLNAREQSLMYCELEFNLSHALNQYITIQLDKGRLVPDKLKKVADGWQHKGRPKVVGFRYDLETQLELVNLHIDEFRFYGRRQGDPIEIAGLLHAMKVNARAMSIRTFCQPDSVIAKQLVDSQSLFKLIGVPDIQQIALAEIAQFFKVIVEREQDNREQHAYELRKKSSAREQGDRSWVG